jgi:hypothetical protein
VTRVVNRLTALSRETGEPCLINLGADERLNGVVGVISADTFWVLVQDELNVVARPH